MTGQVDFDSHLGRLLDAAAGLVNALTPGEDGGHPVTAPTGDARHEAVTGVLLDADGRRPHPSRAATDRLAALAPEVREVFAATDADDLDTAAARVNALIDATAPRPQLDRDAAGAYRLHFHGPDDSFDRGWAAGIAAGLAIAVGSDLAGRLGVCAAPACDRVYVDTSRNGGRRFCSARCQSRVKAAAHRARRRGE
ncbi:CGNR zinc finger domain-containing protein [Intrasporangium sp. YIM S08009]|uniref:CGNR zinc finger domain-containing protein n=1 Tax=Intrasporangium zincisolvens TaxID=3080018 RepID=UPI002B05B625|nr:CGNR zinc finger domain-containing protein [Intrasporangium sp. YIM S08009]